MLARELLLQLPHQPGLDLLEGLQLWHWDEDHDGLLSSGAVNLGKKDFLSEQVSRGTSYAFFLIAIKRSINPVRHCKVLERFAYDRS